MSFGSSQVVQCTVEIPNSNKSIPYQNTIPTPTLAENETVVHTVRRMDEVNDYLARVFVAWTSYAYKFLVASPYTADRRDFR